MASSLKQSVASSSINAITRKKVMIAVKGQEGGFLPLLALLLMKKVLGKGIRRTVKRYSNINHLDKSFQCSFILEAVLKLLSISITNLDLMVFF